MIACSTHAHELCQSNIIILRDEKYCLGLFQQIQIYIHIKRHQIINNSNLEWFVNVAPVSVSVRRSTILTFFVDAPSAASFYLSLLYCCNPRHFYRQKQILLNPFYLRSDSNGLNQSIRLLFSSFHLANEYVNYVFVA